MNAFDSVFVDDLHAAFDVVAANDDARLAGPVAEEAILTGRRYDGTAAVEAGIAHALVDVDALVPAAADLAGPLAGKGRAIAVALKSQLHAPVLAHLPA